MKTKNFFLTLLLTAMMCVPFSASTQVTIGSTDLPQAMLDIRAYPEMDERGQGFRLIDGNHTVPGRVLTLGEDGIGTWQTVGLNIRSARMNPLPHGNLSLIRNYQAPPSVFITPSYIYLSPGRYLVFAYMPVWFNFATAALEEVRYSFVLVGGGRTFGFPHIHDRGPARANALSRELKMMTINLSDMTSTTRFYIGISYFVLANTAGANVIDTHPNAATNSFQFLTTGATGQLLAIPLAQ